MHIGRWIIGFVAGLLLLAVAAVFTLVFLVDANRFKGTIEAAVSEAAGLPFHIEGDIDVAWYPWLTLRTGPARLDNPPGFDAPPRSGESAGSVDPVPPAPPLLALRSARVGARLIPLIRGELIVDRVRLEGLRVHLRRTVDGRANWEGLLNASDKPEDATARRPPPQIGGVEIRDGALGYLDEQSGMQLSIANWQLDAAALEPGKPVRLDTRLAVALPRAAQPAESPDSSRPFGATLQLQILLHLGPYITEPIESDAEPADFNELLAHDLVLSASLHGGELPESGVPVEMQVPRLAATLSPLQVVAPQWSLAVARARLTGALQLAEQGGSSESNDSVLQASGSLHASVPSLKRLLEDLGIEPPQPSDPQALESFSVDATWTYGDDRLALSPLEIRIDETTLAGELSRSSGEAPLWTFHLRGDRIDLGRYAGEGESESEEPFELPVETLRALRVQGELVFAEAQLNDTKMKNVRLRALP